MRFQILKYATTVTLFTQGYFKKFTKYKFNDFNLKHGDRMLLRKDICRILKII